MTVSATNMPGQPEQLIPVKEAIRIFSVQNSPTRNLSSEFFQNVKVLSQIYDSIQRHLNGVYHKGEIYIPTVKEILYELQLYKRSMTGDRIPMPTMPELLYLINILAAQSSPFVFIAYRLNIENLHQPEQSMVVIANTERHEDIANKSLDECVVITSSILVSAIQGGTIFHNWEDKASQIASAFDVDITVDRADFYLSRFLITLPDNPDAVKDERQKAVLKKVNDSIYRKFYMPIYQSLLKDKLLLVISCEEIRSKLEWKDRPPDLVFFLNPHYLTRRYQVLKTMMKSPFIKKQVSEDFWSRHQEALTAGDIDESHFRKQFALELLRNHRGKPSPSTFFVHFAMELYALDSWYRSNEGERQKEKDRQALSDIQQTLKNHGTIYRVMHQQKVSSIPREYLKLMVQGIIPFVYAVSDPHDSFDDLKSELNPALYENFYAIFLDRKCVPAAVDQAVELFEKNEDMHLLEIVANLLRIDNPDPRYRDQIPPVYIEKLKEALKKGYLNYLPWFERLWLQITSSSLSDVRFKRIRSDRKDLLQKRLEYIHKQDGRIKSDTPPMKPSRTKIFSSASKEAATERTKQKTLENDRAVASLVVYLDHSWQKRHYPDKAEILSVVKKESRPMAEKILSLVDVGAASVKSVVAIPIPSGGGMHHIYASNEYLTKNRNDLISYFQNRVTGLEDVILDETKKLALQNSGREKDYFEAILNFIKNHSPPL